MNKLKSIVYWLTQKAATYWMVSVFGAVILTVLAIAARFLVEYAPFSYGAVAIGSYLLLTIGQAVFWWGHSHLRIAKFEERRSQSMTINPLQKNFENQRVTIADFFHPYMKPTDGATFRNCEFYGPATIAFRNCVFQTPLIEGCDFIVHRDQCMMQTVTAFDSCTFHECSFYGIAWVTSRHALDQMQAQTAARMNVVTYRGDEHDTVQDSR